MTHFDDWAYQIVVHLERSTSAGWTLPLALITLFAYLTTTQMFRR